MRQKLVMSTGAALALALAAPAYAHVTVQPSEAPVGSFFAFAVRVPTEREDASTTKVVVQFPENVTNAGFQPKPGWNRTVKMKTLDEPIEVFGEEVTEVVDTVTWSGGRIAPGEFDEFRFSVRTPDEPTTLEFRALQTYDSGEVVRWIGPADSDEPAAHITTVDLGAEEGQGQLQVLAELKQGGGEEAVADDAGEEDDDGSGLSDIVAWVALVLAMAALVLSLAASRKRPAT